ncbi:MAG: acyltransferase family protein [Lachnospiraceae bacterium]|nr:acyltransferase family protein [Lachnospiraceae bacterium]
MRVLVKWKKSIMFSILLLMVLGIYVTIGSKGEEKSKFGSTTFEKVGAVTHIKKIDVNVVTTRNYLRYFQDSSRKEIANAIKRMGIDFVAISDDYIYFQEFRIIDGGPDITDPASTEELISGSSDSYEITSAFEHEDLTLGELTFHRVCYSRKDTQYQDYGVVADYFTEHNGQILEIRCYNEESRPPVYEDTVSLLTSKYEPQMENYTFGAPAHAAAEDSTVLSCIKSITFAPWLLIMPFIYALLCGLTYTGRSERLYNSDTKKHYYVGDDGTGWNEDFLSLRISKMLLGFFAVLIVFHHLVQQSGSNDAGLLYILEDFGVGFVGVFFFFSGYGLYESFKKKDDYLNNFFKKRYPAVLIPAYTALIIFLLFDIIDGGITSPLDFIAKITGLKLLNPHMWYIVEIAILYLLFFMVFRLIKKHSVALAILFICVLGMVAGSLLSGHGDAWFQGEWWYNTSLLFPFGIWFSMHKEKLMELMKHYYMLLMPVTLVLFVVFYKATAYMLEKYSYWSETALDPGYDDKIKCLSVQCPMVLFFVLLLLFIGLKLKIGNRCLEALGTISLELYLIHNLFLSIFSSFKGTGIFYTCVILSSLASAAVLHYINTVILCLLYKKPLPDISRHKKAFDEYLRKKRENSLSFSKKLGLCLKYAKRHKGKVLLVTFRSAVCIIICIITIFPIFVMVINSTKTSHEILQGLSFLPGGSFANNFNEVKSYMKSMGEDFYSIMARSCIISGSCALLGTYIGALCAYGFEHYSFKGKKALWITVICSLMIPPVAGSVGFFKVVLALHMYDHILPVILVGLAIPSCVYFLRMYLHSLRLQEIIEAARIDGCPEFLIFNRIILPILKPALLLQLIFNFSMSWNNTIYQSLVLLDIKKKTIALFLKTLTGGYGTGSDPVIYCIILLATVPSLAVYILFSSGIMANINIGSIKE